MSVARTLRLNAAWEVTRLRRSRRIWLLLIPPVAGPVGSAIADVYLRIPSAATATILGLLVTAGLAGLILLDLTALAVGEELAGGLQGALFPLPQDRRAALAGRLLPAVGGPMLGYGVGAGAIWAIGGALVTPAAYAAAPLFAPAHLLIAIPGLLLALAGVTAAGAAVTRHPSEAIVAGVLAGVVIAGGVGYLVFEREISLVLPAVLAIAGAASLGFAILRYPSLGEAS